MYLPDKRLENTLGKFVERIAAKQSLSVRRLSACRNEEIQFGRFLANQRVAVAALENTLYDQCARSIAPDTHLLLLEDTSQMAFSLQRSIDGLGKVDKGLLQGFYLHPVLTLEARTGACQGISALEWRVRSPVADALTYRQRKVARNRICFEDKESYRWKSSIEKAVAHLPPLTRKTVITDREGDIYAVLVGLQADLGVDYVIRSRIDRPLVGTQKLYQTVRAWPVAMEFELTLPPTDERTAHTARLELRFGRVVLKKSGTKARQVLPPSYASGVVSVREVAQTVVNGEKPIEWILLTSHPLEVPHQALAIVDYYRQRWQVEQLFRLLKTKCLRFESSQLSAFEKLRKLMVVALVGAVKVLQLVRAREGQTHQPLGAVFGAGEAVFLNALNPTLEGKTDKQKNPHPPESLAFGAWVIARLAGWSGYQSQRRPGPTDFFTGLQRFYERWQGFLLVPETPKNVYTP